MSTFSAHEKCEVVIGDIPGAFLHADMETDAEEALLTTEPDDPSYLGHYPRTNTKSYPRLFKPKGSHYEDDLGIST